MVKERLIWVLEVVVYIQDQQKEGEVFQKKDWQYKGESFMR